MFSISQMKFTIFLVWNNDDVIYASLAATKRSAWNTMRLQFLTQMLAKWMATFLVAHEKCVHVSKKNERKGENDNYCVKKSRVDEDFVTIVECDISSFSFVAYFIPF